MANATGHGGPRTPAHPAVVSGPGAHSRRTDGNFQTISTVGDQPYGQRKADQDAQRIAPMAGAQPMAKPAQVPDQSGGQAQPTQMPQYQGGAFNAPSGRPDEPVTAGAESGPGPGPEALAAPPPANPDAQGTGQMTALLQRLSATDTTGILGQLMTAAQAVNA